MSDKTELYATHPKTGKRHRWEIVEIRIPKEGDFFLCNALTILRSNDVKWVEVRPILRDLGPVEGEKTPERKPSDVSRDCTVLAADIDCVSNRLADRDLVWREEKAQLKARVEELDKAVLRENRRAVDAETRVGELSNTISILKARLDNATAELERLSPAPLPVGVVRLPIAESNDDDDNFTEFGTFRLDVLEYPQAGDVVLVPAYMRGASFQAVTVPRALPTGDRDNLRIILRRLDAPEATPERPAFIGSMPDLPDGFPRDDDPEEGEPGKPANPFAGAGPITAKAWELRKANDEKPAPPKDALGTACPRCHGTGWDVPPGTVTPGKEQSPGYKCPDCLGSGIAAPPKGEPKRTALVIFRDGQAVWSSDGYPLGPSMTLHHC